MNKKFALCFVFAAMLSTVGCNETVEWSICADHKGGAFCSEGQAITCDEDGKVQETKACESTEVCMDGACVVSVCAENAIKCKDNDVYICNKNSWKLKTACGDKTCNDKSGACDAEAACKNDDQKCEDSNGKPVVSKCVSGRWEQSEIDCTNKVCDSASNTCVEKGCSYTNSKNETVRLADGEKICDGVKIVSCEYPTATISGCSAGICVDNGEVGCEVRSCEIKDTDITLQNDETICLSDKLFTCNDGTLEGSGCGDGNVCRDNEKTCSAGKACGEIQHLEIVCDGNLDVTQCVDGTIVVIEDCDTTNADEASRSFCSSALKCEAAGADDCAATDSTPLVKNGEDWCDGNKLRSCKNRVLSEGTECSGEKPVCDTNVCRAYKTCTGDGNSTINHGDAICMSEPVAAATCQDGSAIVNDNGTCGAHQICTISGNAATCVCDETNHWVSGDKAGCKCADGWGGTNCDCDLSKNYLDNGGNCVVRCKSSENRCEDTTTGSTVYTCNTTSGVLASSTKTVSCKNALEAGDCLNNKTKCESDGEYTCANGSWGSPTECVAGCDSKGEVCREGECTTTNYAQKCADKSSENMQVTGCTNYTCTYECMENWGGAKCDCDLSKNYVDASGKCIARCKSTDNRCEDTTTGCTVYTCNTTSGVLSSTAKTVSCQDAVSAGECLNGDKKCDSTGAYVCSEGSWGTPSECPACDEAGKECESV